MALTTGFAFGDLIFNLLPMASEAEYSDGARLWQMVSARSLVRFPLRESLHGSLAAPRRLRPRDWPTAMVERAAEFAGQLPEPAGSFAMAYTAFPGPLRLGAGAGVARTARIRRSPAAAIWRWPSPPTGRSWKHFIAGTAGKPSACSLRSPGGTIRRITGGRRLRSGQCKAI